MGISGKVAVVTGAAQGIGAAVAGLLGEQGATVAAVDANRATLDDAVTELADRGVRITAHVADVSDGAAVDAAIGEIEQNDGPIDILVNAAGVLHPGAVADLDDESWQRTFAVNTTGVFNLCRAVSQRMVPRQRGAIVTVGSNAGGVPRQGMAAYGASKAAATLFTKSLGLELAAHNIRCNVVSPGSTDTDMLRSLWTDDDGAQQTIAGSPEAYKTGIPLNKLATPADIAEAVAFLVSERAGHITMHDLYVDGGATLRA